MVYRHQQGGVCTSIRKCEKDSKKWKGKMRDTTTADDGGNKERRIWPWWHDKRTNKNKNKVRNNVSRLGWLRNGTGNINDAIALRMRIAPPLRTSIRPKCPTRHVTFTLTMEFSISSLLLFSLFLAIFLLITVPLTGGLVRLRANYNPKGLQLDPEDGVQPHTGPVITSFFVMLYRVRNLEVSVASSEGSIAQR